MKLKCQVLVVGAGTAGVPAAVAAARAGADTILVEARQFPGGAGVVALHRHICGLYLNGEAPADELLNPGIVSEICGLVACGAAVRAGRVDILPYSPQRLESVFASLLKQERGIRVMYGTAVDRVCFDEGRVRSVSAGDLEIESQVVIDASGAGVVISSSPALHEISKEEERQLAGCSVLFGGLRGGDQSLPIRVPFALREAKEAGRIQPGMQFVSFAEGAESGEGWCKLSVPHGVTADECVRVVYECLKDSIPAFRDASVLRMSPAMEREGARLKGEYCLSEGDVLSARKFTGAAVKNAWPMELWNPLLGPTYRYPPAGSYYEIPESCLRAAAAENLFCAGRCISVSHEALASTRVMGACIALGEAAGKAAAAFASRI